MYEVIHYFTDLQDFNHPYNVGDIFPRDGMNVSEERLKELLGSKNKQHKPLIKLIEDKPTEEKQYTKTDINRMPLSELQMLAAEVGIDNAFDTSGGELKKLLIEHFRL